MQHHIPNSFYIFAILSGFYFLYNLRRLFVIRIGKKEEHRPFNFLSIIRNAVVYGFAQMRVNSKQFTFATVMHIFLGWGCFELLFATSVDMFTKWGLFVDYLPTMDTPWFAFLNDLGGLMFTVGILMALYRRIFNKPKALPNDNLSGRGILFADVGILVFLLIICLTGFLSEAARLAVESPQNAGYSWLGYPISKLASPESWEFVKPAFWWIHSIISLLAIALIPQTKMFHAIVVILNTALTNTEKRGLLRPMFVSKMMQDPEADIENISLGVSKVEEFSWKQLLDSVSCTECSRCSTICPAYNTDKPLSPMKIITDIRKNLYAAEMNDGEVKPLINGLITENELWSCTTCGACMEACPVLIDHIPTFTDMRRYLVLSEGKPHEQASESLEKTMQSGNPWGFPKNDRTKWAEDSDIELPIFSQKKKADVLYWVGCAGAYDPRNQQIAKAMVKIFETAGIDYAVLGTEESCTGDSARRMGEEYLFETLALQNIETLSKYEFKTIVTPCPHCFHTFKNEYPDFGGNYVVKHHTEFIDELIENGQLKPNQHLSGKVTYHDACYLGRHNDIYDTPRNIIQGVMNDGEMVEMEQNKNNSFCCGAGGGNMWYEINDGERINVVRFEEAMNSGADTVATSCSFCITMMDDAMRVKGQEEKMKVLDIAEIVANGLK
ncbi:MAG: 4Fe-4S dicluster domain-containing protein [Candidatus Marinimicrobia bacterium]|nr:4Fe-4S dicluster domain-containing protein [Candidatus Neomarinimicrobiota bacterium]MBL7022581.1 4Fe-4S dicluster domain-containing protein [Candidatus Neomarinimicrobiota bacterium]MBL7108937.1 4Fe-4S dicluster domain-containing protein [Candidatus Neomarinimicrobiota bacterium]